jgi:pimeloyl-ACP methyl ester carboxylesterase
MAADAITVRRLGTVGPVVVVLHGGPGAPGSARGLARLLSESFQVLEPLQRRSGGYSLTVAQHVADLLAVAPSPALIVGHSWGAMLGLSFASRHPASIAKLVLVGCGTYDKATRARLNTTIDERLGPDGTRQADELLRQAEHETNPAIRNVALQQFGAMHAELETYAPIPDDIDDTENIPTDSYGYSETWADVLRLQRDRVEPAAFSRVSVPVLMVHGAYDPHPGAATRDFLRSYIPHLEYLELPRCGHEPWRELHAREAFGVALRDWLKKPVGAQQAVEADGRASS